MHIGRFYIIPYSIAWWVVGVFIGAMFLFVMWAMSWLLWALVG